MEIGDIARIVAYVLPGYLATELRNLLIRSRKRNDFERLASSLLLSLIAYVLAVGVVRLFNPEDWQAHVQIGLRNWWFAAILFALALCLGYSLARVTTWRALQRWLYVHHLDLTEYPSVWHEIWHCEGGAPWVLVRMKDGSRVYGELRAYSAEVDDAPRELWVFPVIDLDDQDLKVIPGLSVYIPGDEIASVSAYRPQERPSAPAIVGSE